MMKEKTKETTNVDVYIDPYYRPEPVFLSAHDCVVLMSKLKGTGEEQRIGKILATRSGQAWQEVFED